MGKSEARSKTPPALVGLLQDIASSSREVARRSRKGAKTTETAQDSGGISPNEWNRRVRKWLNSKREGNGFKKGR